MKIKTQFNGLKRLFKQKSNKLHKQIKEVFKQLQNLLFGMKIPALKRFYNQQTKKEKRQLIKLINHKDYKLQLVQFNPKLHKQKREEKDNLITVLNERNKSKIDDIKNTDNGSIIQKILKMIDYAKTKSTANYIDVKTVKRTKIIADEVIDVKKWNKDELAEKSSFFVSINPKLQIRDDVLVDFFNYVKNNYGYWRYKRNWNKIMKLTYYLTVEKQQINHLHLIIVDIPRKDFLLLLSFFFIKFREKWEATSFYAKECDNTNGVQQGYRQAIFYSIKDGDSRFMTQDDFIK